MGFNDERKVFEEIMTCDLKKLTDDFKLEEDGAFYRFVKNDNSKHYVIVNREKGYSFWVPVNADFNFVRPAGSNNYPELIDVGKRLLEAFGLFVNW